MNLDELVVRLRERSVSLYVEDGRLRVRAPQGSLDDELERALSLHAEQLRKLLTGRSPAGGSRAYVARERAGRVPLSHSQSRLWFLDQVGAGAAYDMPAVLRVRGALDADVIERSLNAIVARHEALRTTFPGADGRPHQVVARRLQLRVGREDFSGLEPSEREAAAERFVQREAGHTFDLARGPLVRAALARTGPDEHLIVLNLHHIVADAWSMRIFIREIGLCYQSLAAGRPLELAPLAVQYPDYAIAQRERADDERAAADLAYWRDALEGAAPLLDLPFDRPHPPAQRYRGGVVRARLAPSLRGRLAGAAAARGATPLQILLAAYATLLHRYGGGEEVMIGVPLANRDRPEIAPLIGFFVGTLPVRVSFTGDPSFEELLDQVAGRVRAGLEHLEAPFDRIVEAVNPPRSSQRSPLLQTMFGFQDTPTAGAAVPGMDLEILPVHNGTSKFELTVLMEDGEAGIEAAWEFDSDVLDAATVARMAANYEVLLGSICADGARPASRLPALARAERHTVLAGWNATSRPFPAERLVDDLFRAQARQGPERIAVKRGSSTLRYGELDARSDELAAALRGAGLRPGQPAAVCFDPGPELIVALLAVVKAGGCYLPIATGDPDARIALILADAGVTVAVADPAYRGLLGRAAPRARVLSLGAVEAERPEPGEDRGGEDPLYLMYTSGSTGGPKGVVVPHRAVTRLVHAQDYLSFESGHTFAQWSHPCFDAFTLELWGALLHGGTLVCTPAEVLLDPAALASHIRREGVTAGFLTASLFNEVARRRPAAFASMDTLLVGGEALDPRWLAEVLEHGSPRHLLNGYGPTECTTFACWHEIVPGEQERQVPIGRPLANTTAYVLDRWGEPAPIGAVGELCLGGPGVALGYHRRPELTAAAFVPNPFAPGILYRTGDRASWRGDGVLRFHGRIDGQVKVRGHRIELGEVEHALASLPEVEQAAVTARRLDAGHRQLVAYVVPAGSGDALPVLLEDQLRSLLPAYMVPARWVVLERLPLTASGKLDRGALPPPDPRPPTAGGQRAPASEAEAILAGIWHEVLGVEEIGPGENFFALGGDSILGIQVAARAQARGLHVTARQVVGSRDLAELAAMSAPLGRIDAEQGQVEGEVPLAPIQRWFFGLGLAEPARFTQSLLLAISPSADPEALRTAILALPERHDALRLRYRDKGSGSPVQWHGELAGAASFEIIDIAGLGERERREAIERRGGELKASLDLECGPLLRGALFAGGADDPARLLLTAHHLVVDAVSWRILIEDLLSTYASVAAGGGVAPAQKTTSYQAWATMLAGWPAPGERPAAVERWLSLSAGPADPRHDAHAGAGAAGVPASARVELDRADTGRLLGASQAGYAMGLHEVVLAALTRGETIAGGRPSIRIDLEGHGRDVPFDTIDVGRTVGWFTALYPMRFTADPAGAPREVLVAVKERLRAVPAGGVGWGQLRASGDDEVTAALARVPPACVRFNYLGRVESAAGGGILLGLGAEPTGPDYPPDAALFYPLEVEAQVLDGSLEVRLDGRSPAFRQDAVEAIAAELEAALLAFARHFEELDAPVYSASDFPDAQLDQDELEAVLTHLGAAGLDV